MSFERKPPKSHSKSTEREAEVAATLQRRRGGGRRKSPGSVQRQQTADDAQSSKPRAHVGGAGPVKPFRLWGADPNVNAALGLGAPAAAVQRQPLATAKPIQGGPVQAKGKLSADDAQAVHEHAVTGVSGAGSELPHFPAVQASFGHHDVSGIKAHVGGEAAQACEAMGASAYASGSNAAFANAPDLHTAAHEAAHVVQQRAGVQLTDGVGQAGDHYERHADAVADCVVRGESAESLLDQYATSSVSGQGHPSAGGALAALQRREVPDAASISSRADWTTADRQALGGTFETANLHNLASGDSGQYLQIEERRDFYRWFYNHTASLGYTTRWALAASLVANGAHQVAHMDAVTEGAAQLVGTVSDELQGMMRIGNQVIFDNVFPKLQQLLAGGPLTGAAALQWDMQVLSEEQTLIQPLYTSVSPNTIAQLENIARQRGFAGFGAWLTNGAHVPAGPHNNEGDMPEFGGSDIQDIDDRWEYGMQVGDQFTPGGSGYDPARDRRPAASGGYVSGAELSAVNVRHNLHMLDAVLDSPQDADPARIVTLLQALTPAEQAELMADASPDGTQYSDRLGECSFSSSALTGMITERTSLTGALPTIVGGYTGGTAQQSTFLAAYNTKVTQLRRIARSTQTLPAIPRRGF